MSSSAAIPSLFIAPMKTDISGEHESVLMDEALAVLDLCDGQLVIDATAGRGGHSEAILKSANVRLIALDADRDSVAAVQKRLASYGDRARVIEANFRNLQAVLQAEGVSTIDRAMLDLGWNRAQLRAGKGFSFQTDEPLDMSYGSEPVSGFTAAAILNTWSEEAIANALFGYGGERYARRIAGRIAEVRVHTPFTTTGQLVELVSSVVPAAYRRGRTHAATKTFQALRIAVNDELGSLKRGLRAAWEMLAPGGRIAVITFQSLEDRNVKDLFTEFAEAGGHRINRKPIVPSREEMSRNRAARSAKMRVISKQ